MGKKCEGADERRCLRTAIRGERYCHDCRRVMLTRMRNDGYFVDVSEIEHEQRAAQRIDAQDQKTQDTRKGIR